MYSTAVTQRPCKESSASNAPLLSHPTGGEKAGILRRIAFTASSPPLIASDVDGTLIKTNIVHAFAYYALNQPSPVRSLLKGLQTAVSIPFFAPSSLRVRNWRYQS